MEKEFDQINVVPFVDIMLVLLSIVLTTATFIVSGEIPVNLPDAKNREAKGNGTVVITLATDDRLFINESELIDKNIEGYLTDYSRDTSIVIRADKKIYIERLMEILDSLKGNGFKRVSMEVIYR